MYHVSQLELDKNAISECHRLEVARPLMTMVSVWLQIVALVFVLTHLLPLSLFWWAYVPAAFLIAGRQGALLQLIHEGSHRLLAPSQRLNDSLATWLCAFPIGVNFEGFTAAHIQHHAHTGTEFDSPGDSEKYRVVDLMDWRLYALFLKDLAGITALSIFLGYGQASRSKKDPSRNALSFVCKLSQLSAVQLVILGCLFQFNVANYLLLWIVPATNVHMFLMRIRGVAEHGLAKQVSANLSGPEDGNFYTRSFGTPKNQYRLYPLVMLERALIGSLNVYYHHEHHLFPKVPFYNLPKLHGLVADQVTRRNPDVYEAGYFAAFSRGLHHLSADSSRRRHPASDPA